MNEEFLKLLNLTKVFGTQQNQVVAVDNIDLDVREGELVTLLGPSGCGKTTTLRMIAGFHTPTSGNVFIDGVKMETIPPNKRPTAMVFQNYALFPHMTVRQNISYGLELKNLTKEQVNQKVDTMMEKISLKGLGHRQPRELSGGQQQRVSLARAMILEPKVLLFDEPLSNLDAKLRVSTRLEIRRIQQNAGITSVYVTHDQEEAMTISDRIVIMKDGLIQQIASPKEIYSHPTNRFVAGFIGKVNFLKGIVEDIVDNLFVVKTHNRVIRAPYWNKEIKKGDEVLLVVRPESIMVEDAEKEKVNTLDAIVKSAVYFGSQIVYEVELDDGHTLSVEVADPQDNVQYTNGNRVSVRFKQNSLHVLPYEERGNDE